MKQVPLHANCFMLFSCLDYSLTLKMEATRCSKTLVDFQQATWHYIPEVRTLHNHSCEDLKSYSSSHTLELLKLHALVSV
jgi:hypothetical protein